MFIWLGSRSRSRKVKGGRAETAHCPECDEQTRFVEIEVRETIELYAVIDLIDETQRAFRCTGCGAVGQLVDDGELPAGAIDDMSPEARERLARTERAERLRRIEAERLQRERNQREREARAEIELAELKRTMGVAHGPELAPELDAGQTAAPPKRRWWKVWQR